MYMAVGYGFHQPGGGPGLRLSDSPKISRSKIFSMMISLSLSNFMLLMLFICVNLLDPLKHTKHNAIS